MSGWGIAETASVIEKIKAESADYLRGLNSCGDITWSVYDKAFDFYMELISRAYEQGKKDAQLESPWILCSEKMPEEHEWIGTKKFGTTISDEVYVTFENEKGERFCKHMSFQNGELSLYDKAYMEAWYKGSKPIAWMPLPEAYRPNK